MIAKLSGILDSTALDHLILDVNGVGYHIFASARTLAQLGQKGDPLSLLIDTHVREDHIHLYGFQSASEQQWFRLLTSVQGVGAKAGLAILGATAPDQLALAIAAQDKAVLTQADGIGPKIATRIVSELKDKVANLTLPPSIPPASGGEGIRAADSRGGGKQNKAPNVDQDVIQALIGLGYGRSEAYNAMMQAKASAQNDNELSSLETMIKLSLQELSA